MSSSHKPSDMVLAQRIRNRLIEYLEIASSYDQQREYERNVPIANVPSEMICMWEDWVDGRHLDWFTEPVFSTSEQHAIRQFHTVWDRVADETPNPMPPLSAVIGTEPWECLRIGAEVALRVFETRGKFDEDREAFPH